MSDKDDAPRKLSSNAVEAANRAEATALLIRAGYRVYRPEADVDGEDLVLRDPQGVFRPVQLKSSPYVEHRRYGGRSIWMLFPDPAGAIPGRDWFLIPHDTLYQRMEEKHGHTPKWSRAWRYPAITADLKVYLEPYSHRHWATCLSQRNELACQTSLSNT